MPTGTKRILYILWIGMLAAFALFHALHLGADFPNHTPWMHDWAKYTDEGWYGDAAVRAHLSGSWYRAGDFNPAVALPVWPILEWLVFFATGVTVEAARGLAVAFFFANLILSYLLLRTRGPRWMALLAITLIATSPFLYCFSRLAILEPLLITLTLAALNLAVRLGGSRRATWNAIAIGLLFTLMILTKTTAIFLLPALAWEIVRSHRGNRMYTVRALLAAGLTSALTYGLWMALVIRAGLYPDFKYLFYINHYLKPTDRYWMLWSFWWSFHGGLWVDHILIPLAGLVFLGALFGSRTAWGRSLLTGPVFGASVLAVAGYILFMTVQNHPQPRYFAVVAVFCMLIVAQGAGRLVEQTGWARQAGLGVVAVASVAILVNAIWTLSYVLHPQYTFVDATRRLARYIEQHPNGKPLLVGTSGDQITLMAHVESICDDFGTLPLHEKLGVYRPGWFESWNDLDPGTLADLHTHYSLEQVAAFDALDDPQRNASCFSNCTPGPTASSATRQTRI